jgi:hypothetical protein
MMGKTDGIFPGAPKGGACGGLAWRFDHKKTWWTMGLFRICDDLSPPQKKHLGKKK